MKVGHGTTAGATSAVNLNQTWLLSSGNAGDGRRYQQRFTVNLPTGGLAEDLLVDPATSLHVTALSHSFNALANESSERAEIGSVDGGKGLLITLPLARLIGSIRFRGGVSPAGKTTQLFRTDGDVVAEEAVASRLNAVATFAISDAEVETVAASGTGSQAGKLKLSDKRHEIAIHPQVAHNAFGLSEQLPAGELDVLDSRIVVRLKSSDFIALAVADLTQVNLTTVPENFRLGLRLPLLGPEVFFLPLSFNLNLEVNASAALRGQLADLVQRLKEQLAAEGAGPVPVLPNPLALELVVESDAACRFAVNPFEIHYHLARHSFPAGEPKQVLRFPKDQPQRQQITLHVPTAVILKSATLTLAGDGAAATPSPTLGETVGQLSAMLNAGGTSGLRLNGAHRWATPLDALEPLLCDGCDLLLAGTTPVTQLHLGIVVDRAGQPDGDVLASAAATLREARQRQLLRFTLPKPLLLHAGTYWLLLESREGTAVWYLRPAAGQRVMELRDHAWQGVNTVRDQVGVAAWVPASGSLALDRRFAEITLDGQPLPLLSSDGDWIYNLAPALTATPIAETGLSVRQLSIIAQGPRPLTVYPPRLEFEPPA